MNSEHLRDMMIYNKFFFILFITVFSINSAFAYQGYVQKNSILFDYSKLDKVKVEKEADTYFDMFLKASDNTKKEEYLNLAAGKYYLLSKIDSSRIQPYVRLGRIYDAKNKSKLAKENFYKATNINAFDPYANFYFAEYFFKRNDYKRALYYYNKAYQNGFNNRYDINLRLATIYEKFGDLTNAKNFYGVSYSMKADDEIYQKIQSLNDPAYEKSEYYRE